MLYANSPLPARIYTRPWSPSCAQRKDDFYRFSLLLCSSCQERMCHPFVYNLVQPRLVIIVHFMAYWVVRGECERGDESRRRELDESMTAGCTACSVARLREFCFFLSLSLSSFFSVFCKNIGRIPTHHHASPTFFLFASRLVELPRLRSAAEHILNFRMFKISTETKNSFEKARLRSR